MSTTTTLNRSSASAQLTATLRAVVSSADTDSAAAVQSLGLVQQARLSSQTRAATLATAQFGKDSSQAKAAQTVIDATKTAVARTQLASLQVNTPQPHRRRHWLGVAGPRPRLQPRRTPQIHRLPRQ